MIRPGRIEELDYEKAVVRVRSGNLLTGWLSYFTRHAGKTTDWAPPEAGEQCMIFAPSGELSSGFVLTGIYSNDYPAPSNKPDVYLRRYFDGLQVSYEAGTITIEKKEGLRLIIKGKEAEFNCEKISFKNEKADLLGELSLALEVIAASKTPTMMGLQPSVENQAKLPAIKEKIDSFR